jgi:AcrR family transcriptional regulator
MTSIPPPLPDEARKSRSDGLASRERLLTAALRLFSERGFAQTSTREIALAASTNIAAISYYFGDKAGLYRAVFEAQAPHAQQGFAAFTDPALDLRTALTLFYGSMVGQLKQGEMARMCLRIRLREMLEPTGVWQDTVDNGIRPAHAALSQLLARHLGLDKPGDDTVRLAFCVVGLAVQLLTTRDIVDKISPQLLATDDAIDTWLERIAFYAEAMVHAEKARMQAAAPAKKPSPRKKKA